MISCLKVSADARKLSVRLLAAAAWLLVALLPLRAEPVDVTFDEARIDLLAAVEAVESLSPQATIDLPATSNTPRRSFSLNARGPGPLYRWAVFTLHNPDSQPRELVIAAPHQRFVGSGVVWPRREGGRIVGLATSEGHDVEPLASLGADTFALVVPPGAMISYVLEVSATGLDSLSLWQRGAFHAAANQYAVFRGMVLGIAIFLGIGFICLFILARRAMFAAAALFGLPAIAFLVMEAGYLPALLARMPALAGNEQKLRALIEALMLTGVIAMLVSFVELRRRMPLAGIALLAGGAAAAALALYGWFEPRLATGIVRIGFAVTVAVGLGLILVLWRRGASRAQASLFGWIVLALWTVAAGLGALNLVSHPLMHPVISAGLVLVLVSIGIALAQLAFALGMTWSGESDEEARPALALAASEQAVWDWQVDQRRLHVGPEIERVLGFDEGSVSGDDGSRWLDLIHPADRLAYGAALDEAERSGRGSFSVEFRLRRADGRYRWLLLRARAIADSEGGVLRLIGTLADVTANRRSEDRLLADAVRDRLTGLPNRALFLDRLEQAMRRARDAADPGVYVIAIGLDRFKSLNDGLGTEAGDYLLNAVGHRLVSCIGPEDTVARLPGDQFAVIWHARGRPSGVEELTEALGATVARPVHMPSGEVVITASLGVARVQSEHRTADAALKDAETALYEAKRAGHGNVEFFRPDMHDERSALLLMEQNLGRALERNEIEVVYQPIIRLADRNLAGFEALMRWRRGGVVLEPDSFVGVAEETGIIRELGRYVLKEATARLGTWQRAFRPQQPLFVAVNISSSQLLNGGLLDDIQTLIEREDLRPGSLKLELTESLVVQNPELAHKLLARLKQMGVSLACDDFGTGYSGLESVFRLPFDTVKIDRCFLEGESGDRNWVVIEAILRLARNLGLDVVAEGIETDEQLERLGSLGCGYGQGYLIGPPVTAQQVVEALGGLSYRAGEPGTGLAPFWTRLRRRKIPMTGNVGGAVQVIGPAASGDAGAPNSSQTGGDDVVIDVRPIMAASKPSPPAAPEVVSVPLAPGGAEPADSSQAETASVDGKAVESDEMPASKPSPPAAPEVVSVPFAPREAEPADSSQAESASVDGKAVESDEMPASKPSPPAAPEVVSVSFAPRRAEPADSSQSETASVDGKAVESEQMPAAETPIAESATAAAERVQIVALEPGTGTASGGSIESGAGRPKAKGRTRTPPRSAGTKALRRNPRRAAKGGPGKQR